MARHIIATAATPPLSPNSNAARHGLTSVGIGSSLFRTLAFIHYFITWVTTRSFVTVAVDGNTAHEVCRCLFAIDSVRPGIEEEHYLAVWRLDDHRWQIETQASCSGNRTMILLPNGEIEQPEDKRSSS